MLFAGIFQGRGTMCGRLPSRSTAAATVNTDLFTNTSFRPQAIGLTGAYRY